MRFARWSATVEVAEARLGTCLRHEHARATPIDDMALFTALAARREHSKLQDDRQNTL